MSMCDRFFINFGLGGTHCFNANFSELDRRLKGTSFRDATELHTLAAMLKLASDLIEDIPSGSVTYEGYFSGKKSFNLTVNRRMLGRFSTSMNSPREAGPFETRLESDDSDWTMTDNMYRTTTFAVIEFVAKKNPLSPSW